MTIQGFSYELKIKGIIKKINELKSSIGYYNSIRNYTNSSYINNYLYKNNQEIKRLSKELDNLKIKIKKERKINSF